MNLIETTKLIVQIMQTPAFEGKESDDAFIAANSKINEHLIDIYENTEPEALDTMLDKLGVGICQSIISDRLALLDAEAELAVFDAATIEIDSDELQTMIDSGEVEELSAAQVRAKMGVVEH